MKEYAIRIWDCLKEADLEEMGLVFNELHMSTESESKRIEIKESWDYFKNNWDGIRVQEEEYDASLDAVQKDITVIYLQLE